MKLERVERNFERLFTIGVGKKVEKERTKVLESISKDVDQIHANIANAEAKDLKKMHENKRKEYSERLLKLKV